MMRKRMNANARSMMLDDRKCYSTCAYVLPKPLTNMCKHSSCQSGMSILDIPAVSMSARLGQLPRAQPRSMPPCV